jgi:cytoskeletal protein CcmA (bactofilin family)
MLDPHKDLTVLASECAFSGRVSGRDLDVLGRFEGDLDLSGRVHVAAGGKVKGRVRAAVVQIDGHFEGEVRAGTLRLGVNASARGRFFADRLSIVDGARLEGDVNLVDPALGAKPDPSVSGAIAASAGVGEPGPEVVALA